MIRLASFHTSLLPVDAAILDLLATADNPFPSAAATYSTGSEMKLMASSLHFSMFPPAHIGSSVDHDVF